MTFQQIVSSGRLSTCRNTVTESLSELVEKGLLSENPKDWQRGMKKFYSLTSYGKKQVFLNLAKNSNEVLKDIKEILVQAKLDDPHLVEILALALRAELQDTVNFVEDVYASLPKNAELARDGQGQPQTTGTGDGRREWEAFHKKTGGKVQVSIPEERRE